MSYHTVYPRWDSPSVVWSLFLYLFICAPTTAFTWLSTFCTLHFSSTFYLSQDTSWVQGFIFEGDLQFSKLFKMTIFKDMCTLKCTEKYVILFTPLHLLHKFVPHTEFKESPAYDTPNVFYNTSFKYYPSFSLQVFSILSILLAGVWLSGLGNFHSFEATEQVHGFHFCRLVSYRITLIPRAHSFAENHIMFCPGDHKEMSSILADQ